MNFSKGISSLITAVILIGEMSHASTALASGPDRLEEGRTEYRRIAGIDSYIVNVDSTTRLHVKSHVGSSTSPNAVILRGILFDNDRELVAEGRSQGGLFMLDQTLDPGSYTLEVHGRLLGGRQSSSNYYYLTTRMY